MNKQIPNQKKSLGRMRHSMPQIKDAESFEKDLEASGVSLSKENENTKSLKPTQANFNWSKVESIGEKKLHPIYVSKDNFILDGHHRWLACHNCQDGNMPIKRIGLDIKEALKFVEGKPYMEKKKINEQQLLESSFDRSMKLAEKARLRGDHRRAAYHLAVARNHMAQSVAESTDNFNRPFLKKELAHHDAMIQHHRTGGKAAFDSLSKSIKKIKDPKAPIGSNKPVEPSSWMDKAGRDLDASNSLAQHSQHSEKLNTHIESRERIRKVLGMKPSNMVKEALNSKLVKELNSYQVSLAECEYEAPETVNAGHQAQVQDKLQRDVEGAKVHAPVSAPSVENKTKFGSYVSRMQQRALETS